MRAANLQGPGGGEPRPIGIEDIRQVEPGAREPGAGGGEIHRGKKSEPVLAQGRGAEPGRFSPEQREQLRRDVIDANRDLQRR